MKHLEGSFRHAGYYSRYFNDGIGTRAECSGQKKRDIMAAASKACGAKHLLKMRVSDAAPESDERHLRVSQ